MKRFLLKTLYFFQIHCFIRWLRRDKVTILIYHGFTDQRNPPGIENDQGKHLLIDRFRMHLRYLKKHHSLISLDEFVETSLQNKKVPLHSVILTFDDGYRSNYTLAYPLLKEFGAPAAIFATTDFIENKNFLWPDRMDYALHQSEAADFELKVDSENGSVSLPVKFDDDRSKKDCGRELRKRLKAAPQELRSKIVETLEEKLGRRLSDRSDPPEIYRPLEWSEINKMLQSRLVSIGSHSHTHVILSRCRSEDAALELRLSKEIIEKRTSLSPCRYFCYPNGTPGDFNPGIKRQLKELGYACALTTIPGANPPDSDLFELKRIGVPQGGDGVDFVMNLYGVTQFFSDLKQALLRFLRLKMTMRNSDVFDRLTSSEKAQEIRIG